MKNKKQENNMTQIKNILTLTMPIYILCLMAVKIYQPSFYPALLPENKPRHVKLSILLKDKIKSNQSYRVKQSIPPQNTS